MKLESLGLAIAGLCLLLAFAQTARHQTVGAIGRLLLPLSLPIAAAALWCIALELSWWAVLAFMGASLAAGIANALVARRWGPASTYRAQPFLGLAATVVIAAAWGLRF
jgi:hypothetical protein